jgi:peptide/nickel transport system substrate-binding protein
MRKLRTAVLLSLVLGLGLAAAQTLVFGQSGLPITLDTGQDGNSLTPSYQILENLVFFTPGTGDLEPGLATDWEANEDATVWTFNLRQGVSFHDGTPLNAEAVVFNLERWNDTTNDYRFDKPFVPWTWIFGGFDEESVLESARAVDETTVELTLRDSVSFLPAMLASSYFGLHSPEAVREGGEDYGGPAAGTVGTGPFRFVEWIDGDRVALARYEDYWGESAGVEQLVFLGVEDPTARLAQLLAGNLDIAVNLASDDLPQVEGSADLEVVTVEANLNVGYLAFHQANSPFDDLRVRQAVAYAIDRDAIVEAFYAGLGARASQFVPPALWGRADLDDEYPYDPERAQELLAEAGYEDGFDTELWYMPVSRPYYPAPEPIATTMASYLAEVGINAELRSEEWGTYLERYNTGAYPMYMLGWSADFADPDNFLYTFFGPSAPEQFGWDSPEALDLLTRARQAGSQEERQALYEELDRLVSDEMVNLPVAHNRVLNAVRNNVAGFIPSPLGSTVPLRTVTKN